MQGPFWLASSASEGPTSKAEASVLPMCLANLMWLTKARDPALALSTGDKRSISVSAPRNSPPSARAISLSNWANWNWPRSLAAVDHLQHTVGDVVLG